MTVHQVSTPDSLSSARPADTAKPFQFTLRQLLILMGIVCVLSAIYTWVRAVPALGEVLASLIVFATVVSMIHVITKIPLVHIGIGAITILLAIGLLMPGMEQLARTPARRMQCSNHLKQIAIALHNYHDVYGSFPPAYIADANCKPMHSWRMLIVPFVEGPQYPAYRFDEPWDGPNNRKLHDQFPPYFCCPSSHEKQPKGETNYVVVVGPRTMWPGEKSTKMSDIKDGTSNSLMVVEVHNSGIHWMEPRDLHVVQTPMTINPSRGAGISSLHPNVALALFADGHTTALPNTIPADVLRALLTINTGETIPDF